MTGSKEFHGYHVHICEILTIDLELWNDEPRLVEQQNLEVLILREFEYAAKIRRRPASAMISMLIIQNGANGNRGRRGPPRLYVKETAMFARKDGRCLF